jgi:hypothetical protein
MSQTYLAANAVMDQLFGNTTITVPSTLYMGLSTTTISNSGTGATEPVGNGYARVAITNSKTNFSVASSGVVTNATAISFPESTASWGTITYIAFWTASSGGSIWFFEALPTSKTVQSNTTVYFPIGALTLSQTNT